MKCLKTGELNSLIVVYIKITFIDTEGINKSKGQKLFIKNVRYVFENI